jgi:pimeloyl-ACP methyl ester carboxylesterase
MEIILSLFMELQLEQVQTERVVLYEIKVPTLVIHGTEDAILPLDHGIAVADGIKNSKRMIMEGVGHEIPEDLIPEIIREILENIGRVA